MAESAKATVVAASTRGTTSAWIGLMPITRSASSSSRMVRAPRSAHMAVAPAPETTSTVTIGPIWFTVPIAAPVPEKSDGTEFGEQNVEGEHQQHRIRHRQHQRRQDRYPCHEPALKYVFLPGEWGLEHLHEGVQRHREEAAHRADRLDGHIRQHHQWCPRRAVFRRLDRRCVPPPDRPGHSAAARTPRVTRSCT